MHHYDDLVAEFTSKQFGLVALWQLIAVGVPAHAVKQRIANGSLIVIFPGVYRLRGVPYTQELRWLAAVLAGGPEAWLSHRAGAAFHGCDIRFPKPEITIAHEHECDLDGVITHRTRRRHDVIVVRGIPVTSKARTLLDCAAVLPYEAFDLLLQHAVTSGLVKKAAMFAILDHRGGRGVAGTVAARTSLASGLVDEKIQRKLELLVARIIRSARVPKPERQHRLICDDGREVFLDNAWPDRKLSIEAEGLRWHGDAAQARRTRARARSIVASGWDHYAYDWYDATETPDVIRREVEAFWAGSGRETRLDPAQKRESSAA